MTSRAQALWLFLLASLAAVALGAYVMLQGGVPLGIWIRNPIAWFAAIALAALLVLRRGYASDTASTFVVIGGLFILVLSITGPGQEGVRRWITAGPIQLNAAALVLPSMIGAFAIVLEHSRKNVQFAAVYLTAAAIALAWQPDISQLGGFVLASMILCAAYFGWRGLAASLIVTAGAITLCLSRPDPLAPVAHVEGIVFMAWSQSPAVAIAMAASLALASLSPLLLWPVIELRWKAVALAAYFAATALAPIFGAYPVPLAGYGLSFVIGWWLGIAALCARRDATAATP